MLLDCVEQYAPARVCREGNGKAKDQIKNKFKTESREDEMTSKNETSTTSTNEATPNPALLFLDPDDVLEPESTNVRPWSVAHGDTDREVTEIEALMRSIAREGQLQPGKVVASAEEPGKYNLIMGRRRLRAIRSHNLTLGDGQVPLRFAAVMSDAELNAPTLFRQAAHENIQRAGLSPMDFALDIQLVRSRTKGKSAAEITKKVAAFFDVSPAQISEHEKLLTLPTEVQEKVHAGELSRDDAFALVRIGQAETAVTGSKAAGDAAITATVQEALAAAKTVEQQAADGVAALVDTVTTSTGEKKPKVAKAVKKAAAAIKTKTIKAKLRKVAPGKGTARKKAEILEFFEGMQGPVYGHPNGAVHTFVRGLLEYAAGKINDGALEKLFAKMVRLDDGAIGTPEPKAEPKSERKPAPKGGSAAAKSKTKAATKVTKTPTATSGATRKKASKKK